MRWQARVLPQLGLLAVAFLLFTGCGPTNDTEPHMTYREARQQAIQLVEDALRAGLQGTPLPSVEPLFRDSSSCNDALGVPIIDEVQPGLEYNFPIGHLGDDPDEFVTAVERLWRERGFAVMRDDNTPGIPTAFAVVAGAFNLQVFVNHNTDMVYVGGTGPCVKANPAP